MNKLLGIVVVAAILLFFVMTASGPGSRMSTGWQYLTTGNTTLQNSGLPDAHASGATNLHALARQDAIDNGLNPDLFERQISQESGWNPRAESLMGAEGIAQFMPTTAQGLGIDPWNAEQALQGAARLMASYNAKYGDYSKALSAYNYGSNGTDSAISRCGWNWKGCVPDETQRYITAIMG